MVTKPQSKMKPIWYLFELVLLEIGLVALCCLFTAMPWKLIRLSLDWQYGKPNLEIACPDPRAGIVSVASGRTSMPLQHLEMFLEKVQRKACITWPRIRDERHGEDWSLVKRVANNGCKYTSLQRQHEIDSIKEADNRERHESLTLVANNSKQSHAAESNVRAQSIILFVHGGALISGSPFKHNPYNWIMTIAHFSAYNHVLLPSYSLAPEAQSPHALLDVLNVLFDQVKDCEDKNEPTEKWCFIGFSAGCFLLLQVLVVLETMLEKGNEPFSLFQVTFSERKPVANLTRERATKVLDQLTSIQLVAGLYRTDNLFLNNRFNVSSVLREFIHIFTNNPIQVDPLRALVELRRNAKKPLRIDEKIVRLYDVDKNSLSNHAIQLHAFLANSTLHVFNDQYFFLDKYLIQHGNMEHKFTRNAQPVKNKKGWLLHSMHYHFFPFIACTEAAKLTLVKIVEDLTME